MCINIVYYETEEDLHITKKDCSSGPHKMNRAVCKCFMDVYGVYPTIIVEYGQDDLCTATMVTKIKGETTNRIVTGWHKKPTHAIYECVLNAYQVYCCPKRE